jgi:hypothetical protein
MTDRIDKVELLQMAKSGTTIGQVCGRFGCGREEAVRALKSLGEGWFVTFDGRVAARRAIGRGVRRMNRRGGATQGDIFRPDK